MSEDIAPPPTYADAVGISEGTSDLLLGRDEGTRSGHYTPSGLSTPDSLPHSVISDSPHTSDDEETVRMKADLRKIRREQFRMRSDSNRQERKKQLLKEALDNAERDLRAATGCGPVQPAYGTSVPNPMGPYGPTAPPYNQMAQVQYGGPNPQPGMVYPTVTYNPNQRSGFLPAPSIAVNVGQTDAEPATMDEGHGSKGACLIVWMFAAAIVFTIILFIMLG